MAHQQKGPISRTASSRLIMLQTSESPDVQICYVYAVPGFLGTAHNRIKGRATIRFRVPAEVSPEGSLF